jgi:tRNA/tmRNA/rRNA uracil-C5-methylase (TrmA/RlmC/RlmD family)
MANSAKSSRTFSLGEKVELEVDGIAHGGESVARVDGWVFFLRFAIPGERVIAQVTELGKSFHRADALEIITPSPDRVAPACQYFHPEGCGGCDFHHISLERQRTLKSQVISEQFKRLAKIEISVPVHEVALPAGSGEKYRGRLSLHVNGSGRAGFRKARSHEVFPIDDCLVASEKIEIAEVLAKRYENIDRLFLPDESRIEEICVNGKQHQYRVSRESFWQGHIRAAEVLGEAALNLIKPRPGERALDLYGGVGLFSKLLADAGAQVTIIESSKSAVADAKFNLREFTDIIFHEGDVAREMMKIKKADVVLLDPPRSGADQSALVRIARLKPRVICYISCDPASLARDAARLANLGYEIGEGSASAYDLFPQTAHIECLFAFKPVIS